MFMATKTLTITEDAYERLAHLKQGSESFSEVIIRSFPKRSLMEIAGILSEKEADELEAHIKERRKASGARRERLEKMFA